MSTLLTAEQLRDIFNYNPDSGVFSWRQGRGPVKAAGSSLNLTAGGEGLPGHRFTEEHRNKIAAALRTGAHCDCLQCGASFWRKANQIARGHNKFCSRACGNTYNQGGHRVTT